MNLLPNEKELVEADGEKVILTTHRIRKSDRDWGLMYTLEFFLEDISSVELKVQSLSHLLALACICASLAFIIIVNGSHDTTGILGILFVSAVVFVLLWLSSKQKIIKITSCSGKVMAMNIKNMTKEKAQDFLDKVQVAKVERINFLRSK